MGPQPELHQSLKLGKRDGKLELGLCRHLAWPSKPAQIRARFCASRGGRARRIMQTSPTPLVCITHVPREGVWVDSTALCPMEGRKEVRHAHNGQCRRSRRKFTSRPYSQQRPMRTNLSYCHNKPWNCAQPQCAKADFLSQMVGLLTSILSDNATFFTHLSAALLVV